MKVLIIVMIATICVSVGETLLRAGMKTVGEGQHAAIQFVLAALKNPYVVGGTALMMVYFALYTLALSWESISFVLPITALSYLFVALLAHYWLHENVTPARWLGAIVITLGVIIVALGGGDRSP